MSNGRVTPPPSYESVTEQDDSVLLPSYHQQTYSQPNQPSHQSHDQPPDYYAVTLSTQPGYNGQQRVNPQQQQQGHAQQQYVTTQQHVHFQPPGYAHPIGHTQQHRQEGYFTQQQGPLSQQHGYGQPPQQLNQYQQPRISQQQPVITPVHIRNFCSPETLNEILARRENSQLGYSTQPQGLLSQQHGYGQPPQHGNQQQLNQRQQQMILQQQQMISQPQPVITPAHLRNFYSPETLNEILERRGNRLEGYSTQPQGLLSQQHGYGQPPQHGNPQRLNQQQQMILQQQMMSQQQPVITPAHIRNFYPPEALNEILERRGNRLEGYSTQPQGRLAQQHGYQPQQHGFNND